MTVALRERVDRRVRRDVRGALLRLFGRRLVCADCGRPLFRAIPYVRRGELKLFGASESSVRISFRGKEQLEFRHLELDQCPTPERPWVS